jgi:hypothetical protein
MSSACANRTLPPTHSGRTASRVIGFALALLLTAVIAAPQASAASRRVPFGFFGVVANPELFLNNSSSAIDGQMALMARSGVESMRTNFYWNAAEPEPGVYDWGPTDAIVRAASSHGLSLLPIVEFSPQWASSHPTGPYIDYGPSDPNTYAAFMTQLVRRYGPRGTFWSQNPSVRKTAIRDWQIWNEPAGTAYDWRSVPWPSTYTKLLKAAYRAIHRADRGANVVTGAMVGLNTTTLTPWAETNDLYRAGARGYFDTLAVNAFTNHPSVSDSVNRSIEIVSLVRQAMRRHGDSGKKVWVTEVTWTAALGRIPRADYAGFETTAKGQTARLALYYQRIATTRSTGISRAFWYSWSTSYTSQPLFDNPPTFQYSGLVSWLPGHAFKPQAVLSVYAHFAATYEGCRKTSNARKCR